MLALCADGGTWSGGVGRRGAGGAAVVGSEWIARRGREAKANGGRFAFTIAGGNVLKPGVEESM